MFSKRIDINICHSLIRLVKMTSYNIYPTVPSAPEDPQVDFHLSTIQSKQQGLLKLEGQYKDKSKKYTKILDQLTWLNACSSGLSVATGISSVATFSTLISLPLSIPLGAGFLTGAIASGIISALTKKYQEKLTKVTKLSSMVMQATAVFEMSLSKALKNGKIDKEEFNFRLSTLK